LKYDFLQDLLENRIGPLSPKLIAEHAEFLLAPAQAAELKNSRSQLLQDIFVLSRLNYKRNGFFVEFGATDGIALSNTYLLEKAYDWKGILAEPGIRWHAALRANRNCIIEENCVWKASGLTLTFKETNDAELSTIADFVASDFHKDDRDNGKTYEVKTISLNDLLKKHNAPKEIEYLSIDTEGSEYEILSAFDFSQYEIKIITCEHNYSPARDKIFKLLTSQGYKRVFANVSLWDDWYVRS
jgi:FkbM family methyltransferase